MSDIALLWLLFIVGYLINFTSITKTFCVLQLTVFFATAGYNGLDWMWVGIHMVIVDWIGLGQSANGLGWIGFSKMDPCPTLGCPPKLA